jgi:hypothetical protein
MPSLPRNERPGVIRNVAAEMGRFHVSERDLAHQPMRCAKRVAHIMLDELIRLTEAYDEDHGGFRFQSAQDNASGLTIDIDFIPEDGDKEQRRHIEAVEVRDFLIRHEWMPWLELVREHPVLLPFFEDVSDLYFYSPSPSPLELEGDLLECHRRLVGDWIFFGRFLNATYGKGVASFLASASGMFASGPASLMKAYAQVLTKHGVRTSIASQRPPKYWDGMQWKVQSAELHALLLGNSYIIAEQFQATKR